jgi:hypothetical protein
MDQASKKKKALYTQALDMLRSAQACVSGLRKVVFRPCGFTSLGALSKDSVKFINRCRWPAEVSGECCPGPAPEG